MDEKLLPPSQLLNLLWQLHPSASFLAVNGIGTTATDAVPPSRLLCHSQFCRSTLRSLSLPASPRLAPRRSSLEVIFQFNCSSTKIRFEGRSGTAHLHNEEKSPIRILSTRPWVEGSIPRAIRLVSKLELCPNFLPFQKCGFSLSARMLGSLPCPEYQ